MAKTPNLKRLIVPAIFVAALFAVVILRDRPTPADPAQVSTFSGPTMGTVFTVKVVDGIEDEAAEERVSRAILGALDAVDRSMSTWREDSEIIAFNRAAADEVFPVSEMLAMVVERALFVAGRSGGAFDPTVGPLVRAWGFGAEGLATPPTEDVLQDIQGRIGWRLVSLDRARPGLVKSARGVELDLSAIAKGFAVDRVFAVLRDLGHRNVMVEIGGEVRTGGQAPSGGPWRIGVETPGGVPGAVSQVVELSDRSMATSGDYRNYREVDGQRLSHTIDPRQGHPIRHGLASVTVIHESCMEADAWATALTVLGPEDGMALAEELGLAAYFIIRSDEGFVEQSSSAFGNLLGTPIVVSDGRDS
jgi:thiamine biosynthesis lipoprotein